MRRGLVLVLALAACGPGALAATPVPANASYTNLEFAHVGDATLRLDIDLPDGEGPFPTLVWIHGGAWVETDRTGGPAGYLTRMGYAVVRIDYRTSYQAKFPAQLHDVKGAIRWLRANASRYRLDATRIGAWGQSAGAYLAALLGTTAEVKELEGVEGNLDQSSRVRTVVDWFGPTDFSQMDTHNTVVCPGVIGLVHHDEANSAESTLMGCALQTCLDAVKRASPITYVTKDDAAFLVMHGTKDCIVPQHQSEIFVTALRAASIDVTYVSVPNAGHGTAEFFAPAIDAQVNAFLERTLKR